MADQLRTLADAERVLMRLLRTNSLAVRPIPQYVLASGIGSGGSLKRRCEVILHGQTKFRTAKVTKVLLLLAATAVLPLAAVVRADDESDKHRDPSVNGVTQPDATTGHWYHLIADPQLDRKLRQLCRRNQLHDLAEALRNLRIVGVRRSDGRDGSGQKRKYSNWLYVNSPELRKVFLKYSRERSKHKP